MNGQVIKPGKWLPFYKDLATQDLRLVKVTLAGKSNALSNSILNTIFMVEMTHLCTFLKATSKSTQKLMWCKEITHLPSISSKTCLSFWRRTKCRPIDGFSLAQKGLARKFTRIRLAPLHGTQVFKASNAGSLFLQVKALQKSFVAVSIWWRRERTMRLFTTLISFGQDWKA